MWMVCGRPINLTYDKGKLFKAGASALARRIVAESHFRTGCPPFDEWPAAKRLSFLATASRGLLSRSRPDAFPNFLTDAAVAAAMKYVELAVEGRTYSEPDLTVPWLRLIRRAYIQRNRQGRRHYWVPMKSLPCRAVRKLRNHWVNLDWEWIDVPMNDVRHHWRTKSYESLRTGSYASRLPDSFFFDDPPDVSPEETQQNERYLLNLMKTKREREAAEEIDLTMQSEITARATRRVRL